MFPRPDVLKLYQIVDASLPGLIINACDRQSAREFVYALVGQFTALVALIIFGGGFVYLVMQGHGGYAGSLLGVGVLNAVGGFLRARLTGGSQRQRTEKEPKEPEPFVVGVQTEEGE